MLTELRHINDVVSRKRMGREFALNSKHVIEQYSGMVKLLNEVNNEVKIHGLVHLMFHSICAISLLDTVNT